MPRYDIVDLSRTIYLAKEEFKKDIKKYEEYLKVSGNNYKYPYIHQISIYNMDPKATACAEFDYWKSIGRSVKRGEKGIPLLDIDSGRIKYIFDIRQTVSINHNISEVKLWKYDSKKHLNLLDELIDKFKEKDSKLLLSQEDKIDALVESNVRGKFNKILESLSDESLKSIQKVDLFNLLKESVKISISERMEVSYQLKEENLSLLSKISSSDIDKVLSISANISKNILLDLGSEIKRLEILEKIQERKDLEQTKELKERYNKLSSDINGEINFKGGLEDEREINIGRQGIPHGGGDLHTNRQGEFLRETGRDIQDGRIGGRHGSPNTQYGNSRGNRFKETQQMGKDEIELSQGEQRRGLSDNVFARDIDGSSSIKGKRDRGLYHEGRSQNDGNLGADRRTERRGLSEISEIEEEHGYDPTRNRGKGDNPNLKNEEVESTSFFYAKNHGEQISFSNPISQREIDTFLIHGGNHEDGRLAVIAEFSKGKSLEEQANFLKEIYNGANGLEIEGRKISAWFGKEGAIFKDGDEARYREGQIVSWKDLANNINNLLDRGEFASNVEVIESATYEREKIAEKLLYLKRDFTDETKDRYLAILNDIKGRGFLDEKENLGKKLEDKNFINKLRKEYEVFLEEYNINPDILRFHHYKLSTIYKDINDLEIERKLYSSNLKNIAPIQSFITQDEIAESLKRGSGFFDGKKRIYEFFTEKHDLKEQADFLKNEYGVGGSSHALSAARESGEWHDAKGIKYNKGNAKEILLSWSNVARRINDLIKKNRYIDEESFEENREKKADQEINKTEKESQEYINYQDDLPPTDNDVYIERTNNSSIYYYQGQSVASIGDDGKLIIYDEFIPNFLKEEIYSIAFEKQLDIPLDQLDDGIILEGIHDTFYIKEKEEIEGREYYLLESQSRYDDIPNIVVNSNKEVIDDDIVNGFEEFKEFYTNKNKENIGFDLDSHIKDDYWIIEFNEGSSLIEKDYAGQRLTKELLDEIREIDEKIRLHNKTLGEDEYGQMTDKWEGYSKFYFNHIVDGKIVDHYKIDIGDGNEINQRDFEFLYEQIGKNQIELNQTIEENKIDEKIISINQIEDKIFDVLVKDKALENEIIKARENLGNNTLASFNSVFQREYAKIMREVADKQGNLPDDMKSIDKVKELGIRIENRYREYLNNSLKNNIEDDKEIFSIKVGDIVRTEDNKYLKIKDISSGYDNNHNPITYYSYDAYFDKDLKLFSHSFKGSNLKALEVLRNEVEEKLTKEIVEDKIAVKVGFYYALVDKYKTKDIELEETGIRVYPRKENSQGKIYTLYKGKSFEDSRKIDSLFDEITVKMKEVNLTNLNDVLELEREGLFEIADDKVTKFEKGYDIDVQSFNQQFPDYYNDIYVFNKNLEISGAYQNLAHINEENKITFNINLSQEEKSKIEEIRDKKEVLSKLIDKDIKEKREYYFDPQNEEYLLLSKKIEEGLLKIPDGIKETIDGKEGFDVELILDIKEKILRQNLRYNGYILNSNQAIKYKSYKDILSNLPYLLDDKHREVLLNGYLNQQIENDRTRQEENPFKEGMSVRYKGKEYIITAINDTTSPKTIELEDSTGLMNGFITGSETILFNDYKNLDLEVYKSSEKEKQSIDKGELVEQISFEDIDNNNEEEVKKDKKTDRENIEGVSEVSLENYKIINEEENLPPSQRLKNNIEAINVLKALEKENRSARKDEQEILAKYIGWGGLSDVFDEEKEGQWLDARNFLKENLTGEEYNRARESTLTAFYTPKVVIDAIYESLSNLGFEKGNILEPSAGTGRFIGNLPEEMKESNFYGVELDRISGQIAKELYPNANIQIKGFEETKFSNNLFDVAIGNIPFGEFKVADREYERNNFLIHDYFFAKTLDKVRDGGIIAFITSSGTMDKKSEDVRRYISERAEFLGAIRLPNRTFKGVAGTEVTSDIIFLKKRDRLLKLDEDWVKLDENEKGLIYNKYFVDNPQMVIGTMEEIPSRFGTSLACIENKDISLEEGLKKAIKNIQGMYEEAQINDDLGEETIPADDSVKNYSFALVDDEIYFRENSIMQKISLNEKDKDKVKEYLRLNESLRKVITYQKEDYSDEEIKKEQENLNKFYDDFNSKHGRLNSKTNKKLFREDANFSLISTLEKLDKEGNFIGKSDIFNKRTIKKAVIIDHTDRAIDALVLSISQKGKINFDYMEELTGKTRDKLIEELKGEIFLNLDSFEPNDINPFKSANELGDFSRPYVSADEYLSGNIRDKIEVVDSYIKNIEKLKSNKISFEDLKDYLLGIVPNYMIPTYFYHVDEIPLNKNGKADRKKLKKDLLKDVKHSRVISEEITNDISDTEKILLNIWKECLCNENIGVNDNYFIVGGDSLTAASIIGKVKNKMGIEISIKDIFQSASVASLSDFIDKNKMFINRSKIRTLVPDKENIYEPFPLTDVQMAYWIGRQGAYNLGNVSTHCYFEFDSMDINVNKLQKALNDIIEYNPALRTIILNSGEQVILKEVPYYLLNINDLSTLDDDAKENILLQMRESLSHRIIDLSNFPTFDFKVTKITKTLFRIFIGIDNAILDGWSMFEFLKEIKLKYDGDFSSETIEPTFRDYVLYKKQEDRFHYERDKDYWINRLDSFPIMPRLSIMKNDGNNSEQRFKRKEARIKRDDWIEIKRLATEVEVTPTTILLSLFSTILCKYSNSNNFVVNVTQFIKEDIHPEIHKVMGDFTQLCLLEIKLDKSKTILENAKEIQEQLLSDMMHSSYSSIEFLRDLREKKHTDMIAPIIFTSGLGMKGNRNVDFLGELNYSISQTPQVWLDHQVIELDEDLILTWDYVTNLFINEEIDICFNAYVELINDFLESSNKKVDELIRISNDDTEMDLTINHIEKKDLIKKSISNNRNDKNLNSESEESIQTFENEIVRIVENVLKVEKLELVDDFFKSGGNSLNAVQLTNLVNETFNINLSMVVILENPMLQDFSNAVFKEINNRNKNNNNDNEIGFI